MGRAVTEAQIRIIYRETIEVLYGYVSRRCGGYAAAHLWRAGRIDVENPTPAPTSA